MRNFILETIELVHSIETRFIELGRRLYKIKTETLWKDDYSSYQAFLEDAKVKPANASILANIYQTYVIEGGVLEESLAGIGYSNLYQAIPLIGKQTARNVVEIARNLTRGEIQDEVIEAKVGKHDHEPKDDTRFALCNCGKFYKITN